ERQKKIIEFLKSYVKDHGYPPTMREIGEHFGFTWPAARGHLIALGRKGVIRINPLKSRGIEIIGLRQKDAVELPVAGRITAGEPILAIEEIESHMLLDKNLFKDSNAFVLRIKGDSMVEAGIFDGDYVVVRPQKEITSGEVGVVLIGEEATVKKISVKRGSVTLIPANKMMKPVTYKPDEVSIVGKVIGVIRKL
ncbi:MAG: transcriptional repressor LexA, partial [Nitrospira sp.]|nr:transcriptional repressor LexA [Nitrospira sp.]